MTRHGIDDTTHDTTTTTTGRVQTALDGLLARLGEVLATRPTTDTGWAQRCATLALINARCAGWWRVLSRAGYADTTVPLLFARAALLAADAARDRARFWRDTAAEFRARAEERPTSDAAGALSNWHELGVTP